MDSRRIGSIKVYKYRWLVLILYGISAIHSFMQVSEYTMIASLMQKFYEDDYFSLDATLLVFPFVYIIMFIPVSFLIEKSNMKVSMMLGVFLTFCGLVVNIADFGKFYVLMVSQVICAVGQVFLLSLPTKITSLWFGPKEVSKACGWAVLGTQLGLLLGVFVPLFFVNNEDDLTTYDGTLFHMRMYNILTAFVIAGLVAIYFDKRPKLHPSLSQRHLPSRPSYFENVKQLLNNRNCIMLLLSFGLFNSVWNSFIILNNIAFTDFFPDGGYDVGHMTFIAFMSGGTGTVAFGFFLDATHQFKRISVVVMLASSLLYVVSLYFLTIQSLMGIYVSISLYGFFAGSGLVISFEYVLEETYPIPESISCSFMNATVCLFTIVETVMAEQLIGRFSDLTVALVGLGLYLVSSVVMMYTEMNLRRRKANLG